MPTKQNARSTVANAIEPEPPRKGWVRCQADPAQTPPKNFQAALDRLGRQSPRHPYGDQVACAIRRIAEVLELEPRRVPTDPERLRPLLAQALPAADGMSQARWKRICSLARTYLRQAGVEIEPGRNIGGHSDEWRALVSHAIKADAVGVSRFLSFCTRHGLRPDDVSLGTFDAFNDAMQTQSLKENPEAIYRDTVAHWNRALRSVEGWPNLPVPQTRHRRFFSLEWEAFPESYRAEIDRALAPKALSNIFSGDYRRPLRASTADLYRKQLRVVSSLLVESGMPVEGLTSLEVLVRPENVEAALGRYLERHGDRVTHSIVQAAEFLQRLAKTHVNRNDYADTLARFSQSLANMRAMAEGTRGMVQRNRDRLQQFDHPENAKMLITLPDVVFAEARSSEIVTPKLARRVMLAVAVEIVIATALRGGNLTSLEVDRHFITTKRGRSCVRSVRIPASEMKNNEPFEMRLPERTMVLMDEYLRDYRPLLAREESIYLFPGVGQNRRNTEHFAAAVCEFVRRETGLVMHLHLFRHFVVKTHLDHHPHDIETARRFLQHSSSRTTLQHYAEARSDRAFASWHQTLQAERQSGHANA